MTVRDTTTTTSSGSTGSRISVYTETSSSSSRPEITVASSKSRSRARHEVVEESIESAVYSYIQAIRALGETKINTMDISRALGLPLNVIESAIHNLSSKGVRRVG
jgi:hypothetical protein